jgi:hypothetical protein
VQDCCISSTAPVIASGLVDGQIVLHRYEAAPSQPDDGEDSAHWMAATPDGVHVVMVDS